MRELMILCANVNVVCRERKGKVWIAKPGAKRGILCSVRDALTLIAVPERMYSTALAQGFPVVK